MKETKRDSQLDDVFQCALEEANDGGRVETAVREAAHECHIVLTAVEELSLQEAIQNSI